MDGGKRTFTAKSLCAQFAKLRFGMRTETAAYMQAHWEDLAKVIESFEYAGERTSMNNIGAKAEKLAQACRARFTAQTND